MRIKSKFKDYYDYLGRIYGEDPNITYARLPHEGDKFKTTEWKGNKPFDVFKEHDFFSIPHIDRLPTFDLEDTWSSKGWKLDTIYVCGVAYCLVGYFPGTKLVHRNKAWVYEKQGEALPFTAFDLDHPFAELYPRPGFLLPTQARAIGELHRVTGMPVCRLSGSLSTSGTQRTLLVDTKVPVLQDFNFAKILPPERVWQDIQYWLMNLINDSPDVAPPPRPPQTDVEKLNSHGFDKRWSFRHRK